MTEQKRQSDIRAFEAHLDAFGADRGRWPAATVPRWERVLAESGEARRLLAEAAAFDAMLDAASAEIDRRPAPRPLADRILAASAVRPAERPAALPANVTVLTPRQRPSAPSVRRRAEWRAAALLAASLLSGLYIGQQGLGEDLLSSASETVGISMAIDMAALGLPQTGTTALEEDAL